MHTKSSTNASAVSRNVSEIAAWFGRERHSTLHPDRVMELYFTFHPRTAFLKTLPIGAAVADIGAGDGSLSVFRRWPEPARADLRLHAYSLEKGRLFDEFESYEIGDWNVRAPRFGGTLFDAVICAHFIEHVADPQSIVRWATGSIASRGRIYLEWPSEHSIALPSRQELATAGVPLVISRFHDDATHRDLPSRPEMIAAFEDAGFVVETQGIVRLPWLEDEMLAHFRDSQDEFPRQAAFWSYSGWSQYLIIQAS